MIRQVVHLSQPEVIGNVVTVHKRLQVLQMVIILINLFNLQKRVILLIQK